MSLATLDEAQKELRGGSSTATTTADESMLKGYLRRVTDRIHRLSTQRFEPLVKQEFLPIRSDLIDSWLRIYTLPRYAVSLDAVTVYNTALTVGTHVRAWPTNTTQAFRDIQLIDTSSDWYGTYADCNYDPLIITTAKWAWHDDLPNAWQKEDDVTDGAGINATVTSITVADADGANFRADTPRFSEGNLIRIDSEYLRVTAVNTTTNVLTVKRGENGTTAAAHLLGADIDVWYPWEPIVQGCARWACLLYKRRGAFNGSPALDTGAGFPADIEREMLGILEDVQYV